VHLIAHGFELKNARPISAAFLIVSLAILISPLLKLEKLRSLGVFRGS
jgi:hypothetical protein